jgi:Tfp pilus assembly protein PilF
MEADKDKGQDWRGKVLGDIAGYLKGYPFLLLALGISLIFVLTIGLLDKGSRVTGIVLFMGVVLLLIVMQFVLEFNKAKRQHADGAGHGHDLPDSIPPQPGENPGQAAPPRQLPPVPPGGLSGKAIASLVLSVFVLLGVGGLSSKELADIEMQTGLLIFSMVAGVLGISAWHDARQHKVKGSGIAIAGMVISSILILSTLGLIGKENVPADYLPEHTQPAALAMAAQINFQQGMNYVKSRDWVPAISEFSVAIKKDPNYAVAYANRAIAYMQTGKLNKAQADLSEAVRLAPKDPFAHYNLAALYSRQNQMDLALDELDSALAADFNDYDALRTDPDLANLRAQPEFRQVLEKHKIFIN